MNLMKMQDQLQDYSKQQLVQEMKQPSGNIPQYLLLSELQRRKRMESSYAAQANPQDEKTVAEETVAAAGVPQQGIGAIASTMAPQSNPMSNNMQPPVQKMAAGGLLSPQEELLGVLPERAYEYFDMVEEPDRTPDEDGFVYPMEDEFVIPNRDINAEDALRERLMEKDFERMGIGKEIAMKDGGVLRMNEGGLPRYMGTGRPRMYFNPRYEGLPRIPGTNRPVNPMTVIQPVAPEGNVQDPLSGGPVVAFDPESVLPPESRLDTTDDARASRKTPGAGIGRPLAPAVTPRAGVFEMDTAPESAPMPQTLDLAPWVQRSLEEGTNNTGYFDGAGRFIPEQPTLNPHFDEPSMPGAVSSSGRPEAPDAMAVPGADTLPVVPPTAQPTPPVVQPQTTGPGGGGGGSAITADMVAPQTEEESDFAKDKWFALAQAGFAMMATRGTFGEKVGAGGLAGLGALNQYRERQDRMNKEAADLALKQAALAMRGRGGSGGGGRPIGASEIKAYMDAVAEIDQALSGLTGDLSPTQIDNLTAQRAMMQQQLNDALAYNRAARGMPPVAAGTAGPYGGGYNITSGG